MALSRKSRFAAVLGAGLLALNVGLAPGGGPHAQEFSDDLPEIGDSAGAFISPEQEKALGSGFIRQLRRRAPIIYDAEVEDYIQKLGTSLAKHADHYGDFHFFMIKANSINAFAVPGGYIGVHSGLILNSENESEVASVLAHEIVHITQRHTVRAIEAQGRTTIPSIIGMLGAIALAVANPEAGQAALAGVTAAQQQYAINFTRGNEKEADRIGIRLLYDGGYDPQSMPAFFKRLQLANRYNDPRYIPEYLRSHPITINRIAESQQRAEDLPRVPNESSLEYYLIRTKLQVMAAENPSIAKSTAEAVLKSGNYVSEDVARYGYVLALTAAGSYDRAREEINRLIARAPEQVAYRIAAAEVERESGNLPGGAEHFRIAFEMDPTSLAALYGYSETLVLIGQPLEGKRVLREHGYSDDPAPRYFRILAEAEGRAGNTANARIAMAEYYY
ncbi:MAG: M48 family metallopeptidase, partial [Gammaproteobacteria bacterium]|nr:M48 family metallopeptidase [Gammaproteobacteria bacterium]